MTDPNPNMNPPPADDDGTEEGTITLSLSQYQTELAKARRGGQRRAERAPASTAPAGEDRLSRIEGALDRMIGVFAQGAPQPQEALQPAAAPRPPAAAPAAPSPHTVPTANGLPDIFNMNPSQFRQFCDSGQLRPTLESLWAQGARMAGAPARPLLPYTIAPDGSKVLSAQFQKTRTR
jgi:hypothetical protein